MTAIPLANFLEFNCYTFVAAEHPILLRPLATAKVRRTLDKADMLHSLDQRDILLAGAFAGLSILIIYKRYISSKPTLPQSGPPKDARPSSRLTEKSPVNTQQREPGGTYTHASPRPHFLSEFGLESETEHLPLT